MSPWAAGLGYPEPDPPLWAAGLGYPEPVELLGVAQDGGRRCPLTCESVDVSPIVLFLGSGSQQASKSTHGMWGLMPT